MKALDSSTVLINVNSGQFAFLDSTSGEIILKNDVEGGAFYQFHSNNAEQFISNEGTRDIILDMGGTPDEGETKSREVIVQNAVAPILHPIPVEEEISTCCYLLGKVVTVITYPIKAIYNAVSYLLLKIVALICNIALWIFYKIAKLYHHYCNALANALLAT